MYEAYYGLTEKPFNLTPDPRFLFLSEKHKDAFAHLFYGIKNRSGFIMVSGEVGTGKTTLCRSLIGQLDTDTELAFIFNPCLSPEELLRKINEEFGIPSRAQSVKDLIDELNEYLLERAVQGKNCVLIIDEAQNLATNVLEQIRLLSNLETETQKLLQIILVGQPELAHHLQLPELRQLNQRITARYHLKPLNQEETLQYIAYRLRVAGGRGKIHFTRAAVRAVFRFSKGTPRVINAVCDRALLIGYTVEAHAITARIVLRAGKEIRGEALRPKRPWREIVKPFLPNPTLVVAAPLTAIAILMFANYAMPRGTGSAPQPAAPAPVTTVHDPAPPAETAKPQTPPEPPSEERPATMNETAALKPPVETLVPVTSETPQTLPAAATEMSKAQLAAIDSAVARRAAVEGLLGAWNQAPTGAFPADDAIATLEAFGESMGFAVEGLDAAVEEIEAIGLPAFMAVRPGDAPMWVCLLGVADGKYRITTDTKDGVDVSGDVLRDMYTGQAVIFWRDPRPNARTMKKDMKGLAVRQLQQDLRTLGRYSGKISGVYDQRTVRAVSKVQADTGIRIDGLAGRQVRMILFSWLADPSTPSLVPRKSVARVLEAPVTGVPELEDVPAAKPEEKTEAPPPAKEETPQLEQAAPEPSVDTQTPPPESLPSTETPVQPVQESEPPAAAPIADSAHLKVEELPPPPRDDVLSPPKNEPAKEVTPPAFESAPLVPSEPRPPGADEKPVP